VVVVGAIVVVDVVVVAHGPVVVEGIVVAVVDRMVVLVVMDVVVADELVGGRVVVVDGPGAARAVEGAGPGSLAVEDTPAVVCPRRGDGPEGGAAAAPGDLLVALLDPVAQPIQAHHLGKVGLLGAPAGGVRQVGQQIPTAVSRQAPGVGGGNHQPPPPN
jgi:hypothetical protein